MKIDLNEILDRNLYLARVTTDGPVDEREATLKAMREACEKVLDIVAEMKYPSSSTAHKWLVGLTPNAKIQIEEIKKLL